MKTPISIRIEDILLKKAKELADSNKKIFKHPNSYSAIIEQALAEYLERASTRQKAK